MKKLSAVLLVAVLAVSVFAACAKEDKHAELKVHANVSQAQNEQSQKDVQLAEVSEPVSEAVSLPGEPVKNKESKPAENPSEKPALSHEAKVSKEEAKAAALNHAGLAEKDVKLLKAELDKERNGLVYEVEFRSGNYEYDYEVSAENGKVLKAEKDFENVVEKSSEKSVPSSAPAVEVKVSKEEAKSAALKHANLEAKDVRFVKAELDKERNGLVYEVEFEAGKYEYDYEVSAENGKVLKAEKDYRD